VNDHGECRASWATERSGDQKAIVAVAHSILVIAYHVLRDGQSYRELGGDSPA
jgi:hypothetical protein